MHCLSGRVAKFSKIRRENHVNLYFVLTDKSKEVIFPVFGARIKNWSYALTELTKQTTFHLPAQLPEPARAGPSVRKVFTTERVFFCPRKPIAGTTQPSGYRGKERTPGTYPARLRTRKRVVFIGPEGRHEGLMASFPRDESSDGWLHERQT